MIKSEKKIFFKLIDIVLCRMETNCIFVETNINIIIFNYLDKFVCATQFQALKMLSLLCLFTL